MEMLPKSYKIQANLYIEELWSVWRALGIYSEGDVFPMAFEEAIIGLCIFGRYDQRLFDEALSVIIQYARFISKNRLLSLVNKVDTESRCVFQIIAVYFMKMNDDKRSSLISNDFTKSNEKPFFISLQDRVSFSGKEEDSIFLRYGYKRNIFTPSVKLRNLQYISDHNQWIKAKLVFGNTVRAGVVMELVQSDFSTAPAIALNTGYTQKSIWNVLTDLESAGFLNKKQSFNRMTYCLSTSGKKHFSSFRIKKTPDISKWIEFGYYLSALHKLPKHASDSLIQSEETRIKNLINHLVITTPR